MRLIDADVLIDKTDDKYSLGEIGRRERDDIVYALEFAPTVDAVEVVRCGECKHWYSDADTGMACEFTNLGQPEDGFCNWGERREP